MNIRTTCLLSASLVAAAWAMTAPAQAQDASQPVASGAPQTTSQAPATQSGTATPAEAASDPNGSATPTPESAGLADIVVTARKTTENLQKAPASIIAVSGGELQTRGISDAQSLSKLLPSANLRTQGPITQVFIRGIGTRTDLPNFANASAFLYNGIIIQRYGTFGLIYDLDRVESISGPQGTLYGGSAAGGAIDLFTALPSHDYAGYAQGEFGNYNSVHLTGAQDIPIGDKISLRGAIDYNRRDSYYETGNGIGAQNYYSAHLAALVRPTDTLSAHIFYTHGHDTGKPITTLLTNPFQFPSDPYRLPATGATGNVINADSTFQNNSNDIVGANVDWKVLDGTLTYIPAYVHFVANYQYYSGGAGNILQVYDRERQLSQELRYNRTLGPVKLTLGGFYLRDLTNFNDAQLRFSAPTVSPRTQLNITDQTNTTYAGFAQAIVSLTNRLRITAGGRYTHDQIVATGKGSGGIPIAFDHSHARPDYKVGVDYDLTPNILTYANFQSGYIEFGYNPDRVGTPIVPESKLTAVSGGFKSRFLDNRLELNVEGFRYLYRNFQAISFVNATGLSTVLNASRSTIYGADISLRAKILPTLTGYVGILAQHARYNDFNGTGYNYNGNQLINAPDFNLQGGLEDRYELHNGGTITARIDEQQTSSRYGGFENLATQRQGSFHRTDLALIYTFPGERVNLQLYARNLENAIVYSTISGGSATASATGGLEAPRTFGGRVSIKWR